jgi:transcriptional regulator with XRE-family HTH domain
MNAPIDPVHIGQRVRAARLAARLSQAGLGALMNNHSASWVSRLEAGGAAARDITVLRQLADVLSLHPSEFGVAAWSPPAPAARVIGTRGEEDAVRRREWLTLAAAAAVPTAAATRPAGSPDALAVSLEQAIVADPPGVRAMRDPAAHLRRARAAFAAGRYQQAGRALPALIATARDLAGPRAQPQDLITLAATYDLATDVLMKFGHDAIAALAADRSLGAARDSQDALAIAHATRMTCQVLRHVGKSATAQDMTLHAADNLACADTRSPRHLAAYASLLCTAAYTAAVAGDRTRALELITDAHQAAHHATTPPAGERPACDAATVTGYHVSVLHALGDAGHATHLAASLNPAALPTAERRARLRVDEARAWHQWGKYDNAFHALLDGYRHAPEEIRDRPAIRALVADLAHHDQYNNTHLRRFATAIHAPL